MEVLVAAWVGSTNHGDELVFAGLRRRLRRLGVGVTVVSVDPPATVATHGVAAVGHLDVGGVWGALGRADAVVFGGGGLVQDETSPWNLPYHLSRAWLAGRRGVPWAGVGLGVGELRTSLGRRLAATLRRAVAVSVRDEPSAVLSESIGVEGVVLAADLALANPRPAVEVEDVVVVSLRPWAGGGGVLPVALGGHREAAPDWYLACAVRALEELAGRTGLGVRFVALATDRDAALHEEVASRLPGSVSVECVVPSLGSVLGELARGRVVAGMRYHAGIGAVLGGRPAVLIGYSGKVAALAGELGEAGRLLEWSPAGFEALPRAVEEVLGRDAPAEAGRERLVAREARNGEVLERLLSVAG